MNATHFVSALVLLAASAAANAEPLFVKDISKMERTAWRIACDFKGYDCSNIPVPQVWYMEMEGTHGRYWRGAPGIEVNTKLIGQVFSGLVMVHEMVHYIQDYQIRQSLNHGFNSHCDREREAFNITLAVAFSLNIKDSRLVSWPEIARAYSCPYTARFIFRDIP